jgi:transcriptional regulator with XRE-family HTH domain
MKVQTKTKMVIDNIATGKMARIARENKNHSLRAIAKRLGFSASYLSDLELGRRNWTEEVARKFTEAINE